MEKEWLDPDEVNPMVLTDEDIDGIYHDTKDKQVYHDDLFEWFVDLTNEYAKEM